MGNYLRGKVAHCLGPVKCIEEWNGVWMKHEQWNDRRDYCYTQPAMRLYDSKQYYWYKMSCVSGHNKKSYRKYYDDCAEICNNDKKCLAFEFGNFEHASSITWDPPAGGQCRIQTSSNRHGCDGHKHHLDLYVKAQPIVDKGASGCSKSRKCGVCEGDCDSDADCAGSLKCFQRKHPAQTVPGCETFGFRKTS